MCLDHTSNVEPDGDQEITLEEMSRALDLSLTTIRKMLDQGTIPCLTTPEGALRVRRTDVLRWRDQREVQRRALSDLAQMAQRQEGMVARRPPRAPGDLNIEEDE
jgi:excisionase family DNA binding protein